MVVIKKMEGSSAQTFEIFQPSSEPPEYIPERKTKWRTLTSAGNKLFILFKNSTNSDRARGAP